MLVQQLEVSEVGRVAAVVPALASPGCLLWLFDQHLPICLHALVGLLVPVDTFIRHRLSCTERALIKLELLRFDLAGALN